MRFHSAPEFFLPGVRQVLVLWHDVLDGMGPRTANAYLVAFKGSHALRHSFISNLARSGVHPSIAQSLARHSTITLTMDRYAHVALESQQEAIMGLPDLEVLPAGMVAEATGTDDEKNACPNLDQILPKPADSHPKVLDTSGQTRRARAMDRKREKPLCSNEKTPSSVAGQGEEDGTR